MKAFVPGNADLSKCVPVFVFHCVERPDEMVIDLGLEFLGKAAKLRKALRVKDAEAVQVGQTAHDAME
jgi:hypothetical protein